MIKIYDFQLYRDNKSKLNEFAKYNDIIEYYKQFAPIHRDNVINFKDANNGQAHS